MPPSPRDSGADLSLQFAEGWRQRADLPDLESANIAYKLLTTIGGAEILGPILMGMSKPVHLVPRGSEVEEIVNIAAIAVVDAQETDHSEWLTDVSKPAVVAD
jgi:hypothetical protein